MSNTPLTGDGSRQRFQVTVGDKTAVVEVISAKNRIYAVELPDAEPVFITQIRDPNNKFSWVSIPQGQEQLARDVGRVIEEKGYKL